MLKYADNFMRLDRIDRQPAIAMPLDNPEFRIVFLPNEDAAQGRQRFTFNLAFIRHLPGREEIDDTVDLDTDAQFFPACRKRRVGGWPARERNGRAHQGRRDVKSLWRRADDAAHHSAVSQSNRPSR